MEKTRNNAQEELKEIIAGLAYLGEIYLRTGARIREVLHKDPILHLAAAREAARAGDETEEYTIRDMVDQLLGESEAEEIGEEEKELFYLYAEKFNDPVLTKETVSEYISADTAGREGLQDRMREQMSIFPDPLLGMSDLMEFGYEKQDLFPVSREMAGELFERSSISVYRIFGNGTGMMIKDRPQIDIHDGMFGVRRADWLEYHLEAFRSGDQRQISFETEKKRIRIYQCREDLPESSQYMFLSYEYVIRNGGEVKKENYNLVYEGDVRKDATLEDIFVIFNMDHPKGFTGHSLSVSDVVAVFENDTWTAHYVDTFGYKELPDFLGGEKERQNKMPDAFFQNPEEDIPVKTAGETEHAEESSRKKEETDPMEILTQAAELETTTKPAVLEERQTAAHPEAETEETKQRAKTAR